jgi:hypothetical protein
MILEKFWMVLESALSSGMTRIPTSTTHYKPHHYRRFMAHISPRLALAALEHCRFSSACIHFDVDYSQGDIKSHSRLQCAALLPFYLAN